MCFWPAFKIGFDMSSFNAAIYLMPHFAALCASFGTLASGVRDSQPTRLLISWLDEMDRGACGLVSGLSALDVDVWPHIRDGRWR